MSATVALNRAFDALDALEDIPGNLSDRLAAVLERAIVAGMLDPGSKLSADGLARHYHISVIPVREALRSLEARGWVTIRPNQGAFVRAVNEEDLDATLEARLFVDVALAELAANRRDDGDIAALRQLVVKGRAAIDARDMDQFSLTNDQFHRRVAECARNHRLTAILDELGKQLRYYFARIPLDRAAASADEHGELVDAIADGDAERARSIAMVHSGRTRLHIARDDRRHDDA